MKHLSGENFAALADYAHVPGTPLLVPPRGVIYCHVNVVLPVFEQMKRQPGPFVLISSQGDFYSSPNFFAARPPNLVKWFTVGAEVSSDGWTQGIPLGMADSRYSSGMFDHGQWEVMAAERVRPVKRDKLLHVCLCLNTNQDRRNAVAAVASWTPVTVYDDFQKKPMPFGGYLKELHEHRFTLAPPGGGMDCHRTWEALYLGTIPICIRHSVFSWWADKLPICFVDRWSEITPEFLEVEYARLHALEDSAKAQGLVSYFEWDMLWMPYWEKRIRQAYNEASQA